eukprot:84893-Prymnesium_polylepis.1
MEGATDKRTPESPHRVKKYSDCDILMISCRWHSFRSGVPLIGAGQTKFSGQKQDGGATRFS